MKIIEPTMLPPIKKNRSSLLVHFESGFPPPNIFLVAGLSTPNSVVGTKGVHGAVHGQFCEVGATSSLRKAQRQIFARRIA
jgi:hypothetical protein